MLGSLFTVALGLGTPSKVALASVLVFFVVFFNAFQGVREVDRNLLANARVLGASKLAIIRHVVVPSALTWIIASLHVAFGMAIIGAIVGEFLGAQKGLGLVIANSQNNFNPERRVRRDVHHRGPGADRGRPDRPAGTAPAVLAAAVTVRGRRRLTAWSRPSNHTHYTHNSLHPPIQNQE